ncbi:Fanconi anemia group M protein-like isoform X2 [Branchiostoma lanceolatum]|uniref:Fanconi anemia group M protein-like isoform X2 n=1 Tax=Branchiostoma lanceolatum TaxID=7740 RepID=UPI00345460C7
MSGRPRQQTLFQSWGKQAQRSETDSTYNHASSSTSRAGVTDSEVIDLVDDMEDDELLAAAMDGYADISDPSSDVPATTDCTPLEDLPGFDISAGKLWIYPTNYPVREYQYNIVHQALFKNTLVTLPTGLGKTFIAAVVMYNFYRWYPMGKVIFMAPTKPLVAQQIEACFNIMGIPQKDTAEMTGSMPPAERKRAWQEKRVFFLTPQVMVNDLSRGACPAEDVKCLVVDEAHKALGNHAFCQVVQELIKFTMQFRVLALSATPGGDLKGVQQVLSNLLITHVELRSEDSVDIQPYTHERKVEKIVVPLGDQLKQLQNRYLAVVGVFVARLVRNKAMFCRDPAKITKFQLLKSRDLFRANPPPEAQNRVLQGCVEGDFATCISLYHGYELLLQHGMKSFYSFLANIMEDEKGSKKKRELAQNPDFMLMMSELKEMFNPSDAIGSGGGHALFGGQGVCTSPKTFTQRKGPSSQKPVVVSHPKLAKLEEVVQQHFRQFDNAAGSSTQAMAKPAASRVMIFAQYRDSVQEIADILNQQRPLVRVMTFIGQASTGKVKKGFTQKEQLAVMKKFREGGYNVLVSTCVGEEGLDIGDVDLIVCFDAHKSPIRLVQRMGRTGRKRQGRIVMLVTEGKEERIYNQSQYSKKSIHKALQGSTRSLNFYMNNPRMVPLGLNPAVHKMHITVGSYQCTVKGKDRRGSVKGNKAIASFTNAQPKGKAGKDDGVLTAQELAVWNERYKLSAEEEKAVPILQPARFAYLKDTTAREQPRRPSLSLTEWSIWQSRLQPTHLVGHSQRCKNFVELMEFIDLQKDAEDDDSYAMEMKAFLNKDDIITTNGTSRGDIRSFVTEPRSKEKTQGDAEKNTSTEKRRSKTFEVREAQPIDSDDDLPVITLNPNTVNNTNADRNNKGTKVGRAKDKRKSPRGPNSLPKQKRKPVVVELDHDSDFESQEGKAKESTSAMDNSCVDRSLQREAEVVQDNRSLQSTCKTTGEGVIVENEGYLPFDDDNDDDGTVQENNMTVTAADDMEEDEEDKWEAIFPTFSQKENRNNVIPAKELTRDTDSYRVPTPPSLDSFEWLERLEQEIGSSMEDSEKEIQEDFLKQPFPCKKSLVFEAVSTNIANENSLTLHKTENSDLQEKNRENSKDSSVIQSIKHSMVVPKHVENENTTRPGDFSRLMQNRKDSHLCNNLSKADAAKTNYLWVQPNKTREETKTVDEKDMEGSDSDSLFGNGSDDLFAEMAIEEGTARCPEMEKQAITLDDQVPNKSNVGNKAATNHQISPMSDAHPPFPADCSPPSLFSDCEESFHAEAASEPTTIQGYNNDKPPKVSMDCTKTPPCTQLVVDDDSLLGVDVDVRLTHTDGGQIQVEEEGSIAVNFDLGGDSLFEPQFDLQFSDEDMFADSSPSSQVTETDRNLIGTEKETMSEGFPFPMRTKVQSVEEDDSINSVPNTPPFERSSQVAKRATHNQQADNSLCSNADNVTDELGHEELFSECDVVASTPVPGKFGTRGSTSMRSKRNTTPHNSYAETCTPKGPTVQKRHSSESVKRINRNTPSRGSNKTNVETPVDKHTSMGINKPGASAATWNCSTCTFLNHALLSACEMCESPKPGSALNSPKSAVVSSDSDENDLVVKRKRSRAQVLNSPETSAVELKAPVSSDSDEDAAVVKRKRSRAQVLNSPETSAVERKAPVSSDSDEDAAVVKRKRSRAQVLNSPDTSAVEDTSDTPLANRVGSKGLRNKVLDTTAEDSDSDFDLPAQTTNKYNQQVSRHSSIQKKDVGRKAKSHRLRHAARGFLEEEAELSDEAGFVSSDEDEEGDDSFLEGFVSYSSQCTQATSEEEMRAVYLQSVRSPVLQGGRGYKLVKKPWDPDVFSQVPDPDVDDYEQDSFCVGDDEDVSAAECTMVEPVEEWMSPDLGGVRTRRQKRAAVHVLKDTPERKLEQPKGKRKRIVMADTSSEDESPGPTKHQATFKNLTTPPKSDNRTEEQAFKTPVGRPPARRSLIGQASGRREISLGMSNEMEDHDDDFDTSRYSRKLCNEDPVDRCQTNSVPSRNTTLQEKIGSTQRLEMSLAERLRMKQTMVSKSSNLDSKQNASASASVAQSVPQDRRKDLAAKPSQRFQQSSTKPVESLKEIELSSTTTGDMSTRGPEPSPRMMNTTIATPQSASSRNLGKLVVLVDSREIASSQQVVSSLRFHHDINAVVCQLSSCDFILSNRMGVERKTLSDFCNSTSREKLVQRVKELCELFDKPCLIVEKDRVKPGMEPKKARTPTKYHSTVLAALAHTSVTVLFTDTQEQTASLLADLARLEQRKGNSVKGSPEVEPEGEQVFRMYLSMPGVHYATALNLYYNCGGLAELMKCTAMQLQMKGKMSLQKASSLHQFLRHNFNPQMLAK